MTDIVRELREDYPAIDVTTVVFSADFAGVGCCVIPQDRVLAIVGDIEAAVKALESISDPLRLDVDGIGLARTLNLINRMSSIAKDALVHVGGAR